ncbi:MAG: hypothetical protein JRM98_05115 [Nitrososphaerota archaeon]|jgi:adenosylhomocysteine nucleosidase|nr:hypothetical protein [Nitrososphaerota archaeon]
MMNTKYLIGILVIIIIVLGGYSVYMIQYSASLSSQLNNARNYQNTIATNYGLVPVTITLASTSAAANASAVSSYIFKTQRAGILIPTGPANYTIIMNAFQPYANVTTGTFTYMVGTLEGIPVVMTIEQLGGLASRSLNTEMMAALFNLTMVIYPGTSGAHLPPSQMQIGDIVIGARLVDFGNFYMSPNGTLYAGEFTGISSLGKFLYLYSNPTLVRIASMAAAQVVDTTNVPAWVNNGTAPYIPKVFYFGTQGSSEMWLTNLTFINATNSVFHEIDEDGDYPSALAATLSTSHPIPFIEISTISDSAFEYFTNRGIPSTPHGALTASVIAQSESDQTLLLMLQIMKQHNIVTVPPYGPTQSYFPEQWYNTPTNPQTLLSNSSLPL